VTKDRKRDLLNIGLLILIFFIVYFACTRSTFVFGSTKDWNQQHYLIPEYFRNLFYKTHDLFPDFAFNLGNGQNIYNLAYYGLLNPVILLSYLLPFVAMRDYIIISTCGLVLISTVLVYYFVKNKFDARIAFISSLVFLMATPIIFHSHRHIMFINYMPFLIMALMAVDKYFKDNNKFFLTISIFLMIMTSYFYSVGGLLVVVIYGIYVYLKQNSKVTVKSFFGDGFKFLVPIIVAVLLSCVLIVPTLYSLVSNGGNSSTKIDLLMLLVPRLKITNILYRSYSLGLSVLGLMALVDMFFVKKKENLFLGIMLILFTFCPIFIYMLNGGLYDDTKVLIPFLPLYILIISNTLQRLFNKEINLEKLVKLIIFICCCSFIFYQSHYIYLGLLELLIIFLSFKYYYKTNKFIGIFMIVFLVMTSISNNLGDDLVKRDYWAKIDKNAAWIDEILANDKSFYRINLYDNNLDTVNRIYNVDHYTSSIYSSSSSNNYKDFYYSQIKNNVHFRSHGMMNNTNNIFYNIYNGNKYVVNKNFKSQFYEKVDDHIYKSDVVLPVGYVKEKVMSLDEYEQLSYPESVYAYLNYVIVEGKVPKSNYRNVFEKIDLKYEVMNKGVDIKKNEGHYIISNKRKNGKLKLKINNDLYDKILLLSLRMNYQEKCEVGDTFIIINGIKNKLTCEGWKYNNKNYVFNYVFDSNDNSELNINFSKGKFDIDDIKVYTLNHKYIEEIKSDVSPFVIERDKTKGDRIYGTIDVVNSGYFNLSVPYDKGFNILVDGVKIDYEKTDGDFIGFKLNKGLHKIKIYYEAPFKKLGMLLSKCGLILLIWEVGDFCVNYHKRNRKYSKRVKRTTNEVR